MVSKRILLLTVCLVVLIVAVGAYGYALHSEVSSLKDHIGLINQELEEINQELEEFWEEINDVNLTFTWEPDRQGIVNRTFRLEISISGESEWMIIKANDDEYNEDDAIGLVFDTNQNGSIDPGWDGDGCSLLLANNMTYDDLYLDPSGFVTTKHYCLPRPSAHKVSFDPATGYTFITVFPYIIMKKGSFNPIHICFFDAGATASPRFVYVQFLLFIPPWWW